MKALVLKAKPGCKVTVEEQKKLGSNPDKGSFVVRVGKDVVVELVAMPRPFTAMKALSMQDVADKVVSKLK